MADRFHAMIAAMSQLIGLLMLAQATAAVPPAAPPPLPSEVRLSDAEKERLLEAAASSNRDRQSFQAEPPPRQAAGEASISIGSGGYRSGQATAYLPVGQEGVAVITIGSTDLGDRRRYVGPPPN